MKTPVTLAELTPAEWQTAVRGLREDGFASSGRVVVELDGVHVADTFYSADTIALVGGQVTFDRLAESRGSATVKLEVLQDDGFLYTNPLNSYDFIPYVGIDTDTQIVWVPLGKYSVVNEKQVVATGRNTVEVGLVDLSTRFRENPFSETFVFSGTKTYTEGIQDIVTDRSVGTAPLLIGELGGEDLPDFVTYAPGTDPWNTMWKLAQSNGGEIYFDRYGDLRLRLIPSFTDFAPVMELLGDQYSVLDGGVSSAVNRNEIYNGVICRGSAPWLLFPVENEVWDESPISPTYRGGPFGERPKIIQDATVSSDAECLTVAQAEFNRIAGIQRKLEMKVLMDPSIEVGQTVVMLQGGDIEGLYMIDRLQIGLLDMKMTMSVRKRLEDA